MKTIGYARVSTTHQNLRAQTTALKKYGCTKIYTERVSGRQTDHPVLDKTLEKLKPGDTFVIFKLDRLSRGTKQLLDLSEFFRKNDINFVSVQNNIDTHSSMGKFFFAVMSAFAEMEADLIRERVLAGLEAARESGIVLGRPPSNKNVELVIELYKNTDLPITEIAKQAELSRTTVYKYLEKYHVPKRDTN